MKRMLFAINPVTAKATVTPRLIDMIDIFEKGGYEVTTHITQRHGDLSELILGCGGQYDMVVSAGGDGTLNETVSPVLKLDRKPVIGFIPAGTTNDFAFGWKIPRDPIKAAKKVVEGTPVGIDVGMNNGNPFIYVTACGVLSDVPYRTPQEKKQNFKYAAYFVEGIKSLGTAAPFRMTLEHDGTVVSGEYYLVMISNSKRIGGFDLKFKDKVKIDDGMIEITMIKNPGRPIENPALLGAVLFQDLNSDYIYHTQARKIKIESEVPVAWTVDGEQGNTGTSFEIEAVPGVIQMML